MKGGVAGWKEMFFLLWQRVASFQKGDFIESAIELRDGGPRR